MSIFEFANTIPPPQPRSGRRPRYLMVLNDIDFLYCHFWSLAIAIQNAGWDVFVAAREEAKPQRAIDAGMHFVPLKLKIGIGSPVKEIKALQSLRAAITRCDPDIVHFVSLKNVLLGGLLARGRGRTAVLGAITGLGSLFVEKRLLYSILRPMVIQGLRLVFLNPRSVMALENLDDQAFFIEAGVIEAERSFVIPGAGLDAGAIVPSQRSNENEVPIVLCVCRMIRNKGILQLVEAARILHEEGCQFELQLVGDIDENNPTSLTRAELRSIEIDGTARWLGYRTDIPDLLGRADVFCLPTYYREGLPRCLVEASAAGRAIVTTDVPGCREIVVDGVNGRLVAPRDVGALTDALRFLLGNPEARVKMGIESRLRFERFFTRRSVFEAFNKCYAALFLSLQV
jgi:glycosyltransferase involved in cell wall biosynthesis